MACKSLTALSEVTPEQKTVSIGSKRGEPRIKGSTAYLLEWKTTTRNSCYNGWGNRRTSPRTVI